MKYFILYILAFTHQPHPDDVWRFGYAPLPAYHPAGLISDARQQWRLAGRYRAYAEHLKRTWILPGQEQTLEAMLLDAVWRERCWDKVDDLANSSLPVSCRIAAAQRLRELLGPVDYFTGRLPEPWPLGED